MMFLLATLLATVYGHGRLLTPMTRVGHTNYENDPTGSSGNGGNNNDAWVCRHASRNTDVPLTQVNSPSTLNLVWHFGAKHVGDCDVYISYDHNSALNQMNWFKIANLPDCRVDSDQGVNHPITIPNFLPTGQAVMRWGWYALHQHPNVEFYSQCADISITNTQGITQLPANVATYPLIGNNPIFPLRNGNGVGYANRFPPAQDWMTGPPCAAGIADSVNECWRTAKGTPGYIDVQQSDAVGTTTTSTTTTSASGGTTSPPLTEATVRCGISWIDADSKCGTPCVDNGDCTNGESCWKDLRSCSEVGVTTACTTWAKLPSRPAIPNGWCQTTCTNPETQRFCDSDACKCTKIVYNGDVFSLGSAQMLASFLAISLALIQM